VCVCVCLSEKVPTRKDLRQRTKPLLPDSYKEPKIAIDGLAYDPLLSQSIHKRSSRFRELYQRKKDLLQKREQVRRRKYLCSRAS
jgi:hypothetical protein